MGGIEIGGRGSASLTVGPEDTAVALGSGDVAVLGTPRLVALMEAAAVAAIAGGLDPAATSVGVRVEVDHLRATPIGGLVRAEATVRERSGPRVRFTIVAYEGEVEVARGAHVRAIVDRDRFALA